MPFYVLSPILYTILQHNFHLYNFRVLGIFSQSYKKKAQIRKVNKNKYLEASILKEEREINPFS